MLAITDGFRNLFLLYLPTATSGKLNRLFRIFSFCSAGSELAFNFSRDTVIALVSLPDIIVDNPLATRLTVSRSTKVLVLLLKLQ